MAQWFCSDGRMGQMTMILNDDIDWRTPDIEAGERVKASDLERIAAKLEKAELAFLCKAIARQLAKKHRQIDEDVARFICETITFCVFPKPCAVNIAAVSYALDLPFHNGRSMAEHARHIGVTRASISNAAWEYTRRVRLEPSRWLRSEETTERNQKARKKVCKPTS